MRTRKPFFFGLGLIGARRKTFHGAEKGQILTIYSQNNANFVAPAAGSASGGACGGLTHSPESPDPPWLALPVPRARGTADWPNLAELRAGGEGLGRTHLAGDSGVA